MARWLGGYVARRIRQLRAPPPIPPNANGGKGCMPEAGHLAVPGPALPASAPGLPPTIGTRDGLWRPGLIAPGSLSPTQLPPAFLSGPPPSPFFPSLQCTPKCTHITSLAIIFLDLSGLLLWFWVILPGLSRRSAGRGGWGFLG